MESPWWRHQIETYSEFLAICAGIHRSPVNYPHKDQWRGALIFSLICVWKLSWVNNREAGDSRRYHTHYDVTVMSIVFTQYGDGVPYIWMNCNFEIIISDFVSVTFLMKPHHQTPIAGQSIIYTKHNLVHHNRQVHFWYNVSRVKSAGPKYLNGQNMLKIKEYIFLFRLFVVKSFTLAVFIT